MSRSYKKIPIHGNADVSDKPGKKIAHRALRSTQRRELRLCEDYDAFVLPIEGDLGCTNVWDWPKDGKHYWRYPNTDQVCWGRVIDVAEHQESWRKAMRK